MREKLIELLGKDVCKHDNCEDCEYKGSTEECIEGLKAYMADYLIANGVTIKDSCIGSVVWGIWETTGYLKNGKKRKMRVQIATTLHLKRAMDGGTVEIREKVCSKTDLTYMGKTVFKTREETELAIERARESINKKPRGKDHE